MFSSLRGKRALITGASRKKGIGAVLAQAFASQGVDLFLSTNSTYDRQMPWGSDHDEVSEIVRDIRAQGVRCEILEIDLAQAHAPESLFQAAREFLGEIDFLINNACYDLPATIESVTRETMEKHFQVNVLAPVFLTSEFLKAFKARSGGRILNLTSGQNLTPMPESLPYSLTKSSIETLTTTLARVAGEKGVTINAIDPGPTDTGWMSAEVRDQIGTASPFHRVGLPSDVASLALFLVSEEGQWITGQVLRSRGGL